MSIIITIFESVIFFSYEGKQIKKSCVGRSTRADRGGGENCACTLELAFVPDKSSFRRKPKRSFCIETSLYLSRVSIFLWENK